VAAAELGWACQTPANMGSVMLQNAVAGGNKTASIRNHNQASFKRDPSAEPAEENSGEELAENNFVRSPARGMNCACPASRVKPRRYNLLTRCPLGVQACRGYPAAAHYHPERGSEEGRTPR